jgi:hypothetical protein
VKPQKPPVRTGPVLLCERCERKLDHPGQQHTNLALQECKPRPLSTLRGTVL